METLYTPDFTAIKEALTQTWTLGTEWIIPLVIALLVMAVITKNTDKWKILALPVFALERIIGMPVHFILITIEGILFVVETMSTQVVGNLIGTTKKWVTQDKYDIDSETLKKREKIINLFSKANNQEKAFFGKTKKTKGMDEDMLKELRRRAGIEKRPNKTTNYINENFEKLKFRFSKEGRTMNFEEKAQKQEKRATNKLRKKYPRLSERELYMKLWKGKGVYK